MSALLEDAVGLLGGGRNSRSCTHVFSHLMHHFEDADENHDGVVSFNEFKTWFDQPEGVQAVYVDGEDERTSQEAQEIEAFRATSDPPKSKSRTEILERVFAAEEMLLSLKAELAHME